MEAELAHVLHHVKLDRLAERVSERGETAESWREKLKADRDSFFSFLRELGVTKVGERLALANALCAASPSPPRTVSVGERMRRKMATPSPPPLEATPSPPPAAGLRGGFLTEPAASKPRARQLLLNRIPDEAFLPTESCPLLEEDADEIEDEVQAVAAAMAAVEGSIPSVIMEGPIRSPSIIEGPSSRPSSSVLTREEEEEEAVACAVAPSSVLVHGLTAALAAHKATAAAASAEAAASSSNDDALLRAARECCDERDDGEVLPVHELAFMLSIDGTKAEELLKQLESEGARHAITTLRQRAEGA